MKAEKKAASPDKVGDLEKTASTTQANNTMKDRTNIDLNPSLRRFNLAMNAWAILMLSLLALNFLTLLAIGGLL